MRRVYGAALVLCATLAVGLGARGFVKPREETAAAPRVKGEASAKVTIVEFSDFQCPACRVAEPVLKQIFDLYPKDVKLVFKNLPLEHVHVHARFAAVTAECAARQGKFWPLHDVLYERQPDWAESDKTAAVVDGYAKELKLDMKALEACRADPSVQKTIDDDVQESRDRWVSSTPTFFIAGKRFVGARQLQERGSRWIEKELKK
jgi:protein-disulfide isomerase